MAYAAPTTYADPTNVMGRRLAAAVIDILPAIVIGFVVVAKSLTSVDNVSSNYCDVYRALHSSSICFQSNGTAYYASSSFRGSTFLIGLIYWFAIAGVLQGLTGATFGKHIVGLRVVDQQGNLCTMGKAILRTVVGYFELGFCFLVGCITALATHPHRRLGDFAAGTFVVARESVGRPVGAPPAYAPPWAAPGGPTGWGPPPASSQPGWGPTTPEPSAGWGQPASATPASSAPPTWGSPAASPPASATPAHWGTPAPRAEPAPAPAPEPDPDPTPAPAAFQPEPVPEVVVAEPVPEVVVAEPVPEVVVPEPVPEAVVPEPVPEVVVPEPEPVVAAEPVVEPVDDAPGWAAPEPVGTWAPEPEPTPQPVAEPEPTPEPVAEAEQPAQAEAPSAREPQWDPQRNAWVFWEAETNRWLQHDPATGAWGPLR